MQGLERFFGGNPIWVLIRLALISIIIGIVLASLRIQPREIMSTVRKFLINIYQSGYWLIDSARDYFLLGAVIVFPIWLILRFIALSRGSGGGDRK